MPIYTNDDKIRRQWEQRTLRYFFFVFFFCSIYILLTSIYRLHTTNHRPFTRRGGPFMPTTTMGATRCICVFFLFFITNLFYFPFTREDTSIMSATHLLSLPRDFIFLVRYFSVVSFTNIFLKDLVLPFNFYDGTEIRLKSPIDP